MYMYECSTLIYDLHSCFLCLFQSTLSQPQMLVVSELDGELSSMGLALVYNVFGRT